MKKTSIKPKTVHLIGICGVGMGSFAGLLRAAGYRVTGSDSDPYPPMSTELEKLGIEIARGYDPANLKHEPDLVVVGNICRENHPEASFARSSGMVCKSFPGAVRDLFLMERKVMVVAGTHGKTTTSSLISFLLHAAGKDPSFLIGGVTSNFGSGYRLGAGPWFVIEGDEYDSAFFEKRPKFLSYNPSAAVITSVEHDHIDIYKSFDDYKKAFAALVDIVPRPGPLVMFGGDPICRELASLAACDVVLYDAKKGARQGADWIAEPVEPNRFELFVNGKSAGIFSTPLFGRHNMLNATAALAICNLAAGVPLKELAQALPEFKGVKRRQELVGTPGGVSVYDDFAHHPTAVKETLFALSGLHPKGRLLAAFEPRSATACRKLHQDMYVEAFDDAGFVIIAPVGRNLPDAEKLDTGSLAERISARGVPAAAALSLDEVLDRIAEWVRPGDGVALMSNGGFGGLGKRILERLG